MTYCRADHLHDPRYRVRAHDEVTAAVADFLRRRGLEARVVIIPRPKGGRSAEVYVGDVRLAVRVAMARFVQRSLTIAGHVYGPYRYQFFCWNLHSHGHLVTPQPAFWVLVPDSEIALAFVVPARVLRRKTVSLLAGVHVRQGRRSVLYDYQGRWDALGQTTRKAAIA